MQASEDSKTEEKSEENKPPVSDKPETPTTAEFVFRNYYYNVVNVDIGEGFKMMRETFNSSWLDEESAVTVLKCPMPLGMVIDEVKNLEGRKKGHFEIVEVFEDSNAEKAGIKVGDAIRACNATVRKRVNDATAFVEADTSKTKALFTADGNTFDALIGAIQTNKEEDYITLVIERRKPAQAVI